MATTATEDAWKSQDQWAKYGDQYSLAIQDLRRRVEALEARAAAEPEPAPAAAADRPLWAQMATTYDETPEVPEDWAAVLDVVADWLAARGCAGSADMLHTEALRAREGACCEWLGDDDDRATLRAARRPKPPSLKEQALDQLAALERNRPLGCNTSTIRRALEALSDE